MMKESEITFEVGYNNDGIWSVNMVAVRSIDAVESAIAVTRYAAARAARYGYDDYYVSHSPLADWQIIEHSAKGMPIKHIEPA